MTEPILKTANIDYNVEVEKIETYLIKHYGNCFKGKETTSKKVKRAYLLSKLESFNIDIESSLQKIKKIMGVKV